MKVFLKNRIWDLILCTAISLSLVYPVFAGFVLKDRLSPSVPAVLVLQAVIQLFLLLTSYNRKLKIIRAVTGVGLLAVFLVFSGTGNPFAHEENRSLAVTLFIIVLTGLLVFLAARTRPGIVMLFVLGVLVIAGSRFLQFPVKNWSLILFLFSVFVLFWYRNYTLALMQAQTGHVQMAAYMRQTLLICLLGIGLSGGIFAGIVRPLHPPTQELKLITRLERMDLLKVMGVSETKTILNPDLEANAPSDSSASGNKTKGTASGERKNQTKQEDAAAGRKQKTGADANTDPDSRQTQASEQRHYEIHRVRVPWVLIFTGILIAAYFTFRILNRRHWERKVRSLEREERMINYYRFFLQTLSGCGFQKPENHTLLEYAANMKREMPMPAEEKGIFSTLTEIYCRTVYGGQQVTEREDRLFLTFYQSFRKNLRKEIGIFRYLGRYYFRSLV